MPDYSVFPTPDEYERLVEEEAPVYSLAGEFHVYRWGDGYVTYDPYNEGKGRLYPSIEEAATDAEINYVTDATGEVSSELSAEEVASFLQTFDETVQQVTINGDLWESDASGEFQRA